LLVALALVSSMLAAALIKPSQSLAQTRKATCPSSAARGKAKSSTSACAKSRHKRRHHDTSRHNAKHAVSKLPKGISSTVVEAYCEDGSAPVRARDGSFSCEDGSEPLCEDGATPAHSKNGTRLVCPVFSEEEASASEVECEEGESAACVSEASSAAGEETCEASASDSTGALCEDEAES
jgi:hypothetical protein